MEKSQAYRRFRAEPARGTRLTRCCRPSAQPWQVLSPVQSPEIPNLFFCGVGVSHAAERPQAGIIRGKVMAAPGKPVTLQGTPLTTRVQPDGTFELRDVRVGVFYTLVVGPHADHVPPHVQPMYLVLYNVRVGRPGEATEPSIRS